MASGSCGFSLSNEQNCYLNSIPHVRHEHVPLINPRPHMPFSHPRAHMGGPPGAISFLLEIELRGKDQKDSLGRDKSNDTQFYLLRSVIDLPGQVKLKNVAVLGHRWISSALLIKYRWRCCFLVPSQLEPLCHTTRPEFCCWGHFRSS